MHGCESWTVKKAECWRIDAFELWCWRRLLRVPWTSRRSNQPIHPKGNQSWMFIERTDVEAETPILWPPDVKNWLIWKDPDAGKHWRQARKGTRGCNSWMASLIQWHDFEQASGVHGRQGSLACYSPWGGKELDMTEWLNWLNWQGEIMVLCLWHQTI